MSVVAKLLCGWMLLCVVVCCCVFLCDCCVLHIAVSCVLFVVALADAMRLVRKVFGARDALLAEALGARGVWRPRRQARDALEARGVWRST